MPHLSIAFYGSFRPFHVEAETIDACIASAKKSVSCQDMLKTIKRAKREMVKHDATGCWCVSIELHTDSGASVLLASHKRDPWLDSITQDMPQHPLISY